MRFLVLGVVCGLLGGISPVNVAGVELRVMQSRVFVQDEAEGRLYWADMARPTNASQPAPKPVNLSEIEGFPRLDPEKQSLVQMRASGKSLMIAIHDSLFLFLKSSVIFCTLYTRIFLR